MSNTIASDLVSYFRLFLARKKLVLGITMMVTLLGLFYALLLPNVYTASTTFVPQSSSGSNASPSGLGGLASLAGISLSGLSGGSDIPPNLYPKIINSIDFRFSLLNAPILLKNGDTITYRKYYEEISKPGLLHYLRKYTVGLLGTLLKKVKVSDKSDKEQSEFHLIQITVLEFGHFQRLANQVKIEVNDKEGFVQLSVTMTDRYLAAQMTDHAQKYLQEELIAYKVEKARDQLKFTQERFNEKKKIFEESQDRLAKFRDRNKNITSSIIENQESRLQAEYDLAFSVYSELAKQLEQTKLQVSKETPIFSIIDPVSVPFEKSAPSRLKILIACMVLGVLISSGLIFGLEYKNKLKSIWNSSN